MKRSGSTSRRSRLMVTLQLVLLIGFSIACSSAPGYAHAQSNQKRPQFTFGKMERELLDQCAALDQKFEREGYIYEDRDLAAYIEKIGQSVLPPIPPPDRVTWRFRVLRDPLANAFALPNGSIYIHMGLLSLLENEAQLASVLRHEITHVVNRHAFLLTRDIRKKSVAMHVIAAVGAYVPVGGAVGAAITVATTVVPFLLVSTIYGYSRELEKEADLAGFERLAAAGYDPAEMTDAFKRLQKEYEVKLTRIFYNDHPKLKERIAYTNELVQRQPAGSDRMRTGEIGREHYLSNTEKAARENVHADIASGRFRTAVALAQKLVDFNGVSSSNVYCLGEAYRALGPRTPDPADELAEREKKEVKHLKKNMTLEEEAAALLSTEAGKSAWKTNQAKAEALYRKALQLDDTNADPYKGLGFLFETAGKREEALSAFQTYLQMCPNAIDRLRISRRMEALEGNIKK